MATQEQISAARRHIEQLRDQHGGDVRGLIHLIDAGAIKGPAADRLLRDVQSWDQAFRAMFDRALSLLETLRPDGTRS
ncbi:hypothetical protein MF672_006535 [Actinomadura sp. ATCC 31491]|uniref:Uncharacterized protein n=1 Tax=Actinomadura luzonensis TaxID=2805427 RepID=A0ABT0FNI0_9ACTN|nr:hypothetical protein [Actinomadura luzonensis]MCK2213451.1 hypothetical protein [Actinomadura luzonensis]